MALLKGAGDFFSLDIGTNAVRVLQLQRSGKDTWALEQYGYAQIPEKISMADSPEAKRQLGEIIMTAVGQSGIKTLDVAVGLPSQRTFTTVIDIPKVDERDLNGILKYQIDKYIPMPMEDAKVDWSLLGQSFHDPNQLEVLLTSVANNYSESRLDFVESLGFNVIALEPDPIAMMRSLLPRSAMDACLVVDMGEQSTDIVAAYQNSPRLVRTIPIGLSSLTKSAVQSLSIKDEQARQFILKFGLAPDRLEGQVVQALQTVLENFSSELSKSIKFFQTRYPNIPLNSIFVSGYASTIPRFIEFVSTKTNIQTAPANPWQSVTIPQVHQEKLLPVMHEFAAAVGLAERNAS